MSFNAIRIRAFAITTTLVSLSSLLACNATQPGGGEPWAPLPEDGRADNYYSTNAREFTLSGFAHAWLPEGYAELDAEAQTETLNRLVDGRLSVVSRALRSHIDGVVREASGGATGDDASYFTYFRRDPAEAQAPEALDDGRARFPFEIDFVGSVYLMSRVAPDDGSASRTFTVQVSDWNGEQQESIEVEINGSESRDAFPRFNELFADGVYDIAVHFGGDYNEERLDLDTARWLVEHLIESDSWQNEAVASFEELTIDSPPFTRTLLLEGQNIDVRVYIYHSDMVDPAEESRLSEVMRASLAERDVVMYSGHAGPGAGFILDYQPRHEISAGELAELPLAEKYQIYILDGCQTYRTYVDDLMQNERKTFDNVDIMTTINTTPFSVGYQLIWEVLYWLTLTDDSGNHFPVSWGALLRGLNTRRFSSVHYGVHGIDNDPRLNPHASEGLMCQPCEGDWDCGAGGNMCLQLGGEQRVCGVACTTDTACGSSNRCARLTDDPDLFYIPKQCIPRDYTCE